MNGVQFDEVLNEYIIEWAHQTGIGAKLRVEGYLDLSLDIKQTIYRILQEALANVARHSSAQHVDIAIQYGNSRAQFTIVEDGLGFDIQQYYDGIGLESMRERTESLKGDFQIESETGQGTKIIVTFPT